MIGFKEKVQFRVREEDLAIKVGSGTLPVLATPALIAKVENACMQLVSNSLSKGEGTVGGFISIKHLKPSLLDEPIIISVEVVEVNKSKISYIFEVSNKQEFIIAEGNHDRFIISEEDFMSKLNDR